MKALILIGGMGTRLRPLTCDTPKPLLPLINRPFLEYQIELLRKHGIKDIILCVAYLPHSFENYFGNGKKWGVRIQYVHEKEPLGTGGGIRNASKYIDDTTVILNGDILTDINLSAMLKYHKEKKALVSIALTRVKDPTIYGLVETTRDGRIERFLEKPSWDEITCNTINAGIYIFEQEVLKFIPDGINYSVERGLFPSLLRDNYNIFGYTFKGYWLDIGTVEKYLQAHFDLMMRNVDFPLPGRMRQDNVWVGKQFKWGNNIELSGNFICGNNVKIEDSVQILGNVCVGDDVRIGKGCNISNSIILSGTRIDEGVKLENVLIGKNCIIEANAQLTGKTVLGNGSVIKKYSKL
jgi:NDP-sugar pyrophosphorylase family protein